MTLVVFAVAISIVLPLVAFRAGTLRHYFFADLIPEVACNLHNRVTRNSRQDR